MPAIAEARSNPKSADYQLKNSLIAQLGSRVNYPQIDRILFDLGNSLRTSPSLSIKQRGKFLDALADSSLLTYHSDYCHALEEAEEISRDKIKVVEATLDGIQWAIEQNDSLQIRTVVVAAQLTSHAPSERQHILTIAELLNTAHLAAGSDLITYATDDEDKPGIKKFENLEEQVYLRRKVYAKELISSGLVDSIDVDDIDELSLAEFRDLRNYGETYDMLIAIHFIKGFKAQNTVERFKELQEVIHAGTAMGMRDKTVSTERLLAEY